jgi:diguanylate cyclase (GGDEF)-like protein
MGRRYQFGMDSLTLGRSEECNVCIPDTSISRQHAKIEPDGEGFVVHDLQSTNGTCVNDVRIQNPVSLRNGDYLRVGNCIFRFLAGGNIEAEYHDVIYRLTILDGLTQIHNRRFLTEYLDNEVARSQRYDRPFSLLLLDIDKFKSINDRYGHLCGDAVLRDLSNRVRPTVRKGDLFARYGGEEFALAMVETHIEQAVEAAERLRLLVADQPFEFGNQTLQVTASIGVASMTDLSSPTPMSLLESADSRLYRAKQSGRNRVVSCLESETVV